MVFGGFGIWNLEVVERRGEERMAGKYVGGWVGD